LFDDEAVAVTREFVQLKLRLMPYLYTQSAGAVRDGDPLMRPVFLEYPDDPNAYNLDLQYMLGTALMVAPVFRADGIARFYLPAGKWTRLIGDAGLPPVIDSRGEWFEEKHSFHSLPLFVREGYILATNPEPKTADYEFTDGVEIDIYQPSKERGERVVNVVNRAGEFVGKIKWTWDEDAPAKVRVETHGLTNVKTVRVHCGVEVETHG
jgi:alpha-D-xyloside xylohydrolase